MKLQSVVLKDLSFEDAFNQTADEMAERFGMVAALFVHWREPAVSRKVLSSLLARDGELFRSMLDQGGFQARDCVWISEVVDVVTSSPTRQRVCRLRTNLTPEEKQTYLMLSLQFRQSGQTPQLARRNVLTAVGEPGPVIPPGPFLSALEAAGLVSCADETVASAGLEQILSPPQRRCPPGTVPQQ